jgi:hypothetical protein
VDEADRPHRHDLRAVGAAHHEPLRGQALIALFRFVQLELAWPLGPPDGRHVLRAPNAAQDAEAARPIAHVVVLATLEAPRRSRSLRARGRARAPEPEPRPPTMASGRATVITVRDPFAEPAAAREWLQRAGEAELAEALGVLDRLLHAHRVATADPAMAPLDRSRLIAGRFGYCAGEEVADGHWTAARELSQPGGPSRGSRPRRAGVGGLVSEARLAALLGGTDRALACEELALRARLDLDRDRPREAALQLLVALDAAIAELTAEGPAAQGAERVAALRERRASTAAAAQTALTGTPSAEARAEVAETVAMLEAALRARPAERGR